MPELIAREPLKAEMLSVYLPAPMASVASVGCDGFVMDCSDPRG